MTSLEKKSILLSAISTAVAILLLGYSAFGWITMNSDIKATGINVSAIVPDGLEISTDENNGYESSISVNLKEAVELVTAGSAYEFDAGSDNFFLLPASSYDGLTMWETGNANGIGQAMCNEDEFNEGHPIMYNLTANAFEGHYIDVKLWIRTPSKAPLDVGISLDNTEIVSANSSSLANVVRIAFLNSSADGLSYTSNTDYTDSLVFADTSKSRTSTVVTQSSLPGVSEYASPKYLSFTNEISDQAICALAGAGSEATFSKTCFTLRIWIEGQDAACVSDLGGKSFSIKLAFTALDS